MKDVLRNMLESNSSKLDPKEFKSLYIQKIYPDQGNGRTPRAMI
jgi:hypothetical protein